jgi:beta-mannosidase
MFMPRALRNPAIYERLFQDSLEAGYNGLRFWGGGQFEYDIFY